MSVHTISLETQVVGLDATKAFDGLTQKERAYAHALARADWEGAKICLLQTSPESAPIFCLLQLVFSAQPVCELVATAQTNGLTELEIEKALCWIAAFYGNMGNYKSFGDTKFVPDLAPDRFEAFLTSGKASSAAVADLWRECQERVYSLAPRQRQLGLGAANGISTYFSANCEEADAAIAGRFLENIGLSPYNTRLFKSADGVYTIRIASAVVQGGDDAVGRLCREHAFEGVTFVVRRGDYAPIMARVVAALKDAIPHVADDTQRRMVEKLILSFELGSIEEHMNASRIWVTDKGPAVESYIGFIESYRDPSGVRGEWEGFVACVNREVSKKFGALVDGAEDLLKLFPWPDTFEKDVFLRPDFTSLDVLAFGSSGVPAGIVRAPSLPSIRICVELEPVCSRVHTELLSQNIPNYDTIRQSEGFKNVSLGNVLAASYGAGDKPVSFIRAEDQALFKKWKSEAFEVQVGIHELLGHGSGKLFHQGTADSDALVESKMLHPITQEPITGPFYPRGSTWDSTFGKIASTYEECRAECSGIFLCLEQSVLEIFGHETRQLDGEGGISDIVYTNWLLMVRAGLLGLEFYTPETKGWRQAHMQARYVILRVLLQAGNLVSIVKSQGTDGEPDLEIKLERKLISSLGRDTIGEFLLKLQTHKSLGDFSAGSLMYNELSEVPEEMLALRAIVMARKEPRKLLVQPHITMREGEVVIDTFQQSFTGMIASFVSRFPEEDQELMELYQAEKATVSD